MVARQLTAATHFSGQLSCKASGHGRAMLAPTRVFASLGPKYSCPPHGSLPHRLRAKPPAEGAKGRVFACCACKRLYFRFRLVKNHLMWYTISLQVHRQTRCKPATQSYRGPSGQPVANKKLLFYCRRQLRVLLGQELTMVKTHRYTGGTKQGIYNALLFFAARGYCLIRSDSAFRYGSAMS